MKIVNIIGESKLGIHDISFMHVDKHTKLPRFNMPFETGMFFAAKSFGSGRHKTKIALVLDSKGFRYRKSLSDISGQDISIHGGNAKKAVRHVRDWIDTCQIGKYSLPGGDHIYKQYRKFARNLPATCIRLNLKDAELTYADTCRAIEAWIKDNP